ncbi:Protein-S-isoprenylcysteine O-methyltransferase Ste14 [Paenibacillus sp. GP183]|nr:Protein-S-isoprenylcysteine O-methyltransferase Ste14 [Paenibacillus sp. GP183]
MTWMVIIPSLIHFFSTNQVNSLLYIGIIIGLLGVRIRYSSMKNLGRFYSRNIGVQGEHSIVQSGWYQYIRHPGYLGTFLTYLGFAISTSSLTAVGINIVLFFIAYSYRINVEEQTLISKFGEKYRQFQHKTWRLIPFLY